MSDEASVKEQRTASIHRLLVDHNSSLPSSSLSSHRPSVVMEEESRKTEEDRASSDSADRPGQVKSSNILYQNNIEGVESDEDGTDSGNVKRRSIKRQYM